MKKQFTFEEAQDLMVKLKDFAENNSEIALEFSIDVTVSKKKLDSTQEDISHVINMMIDEGSLPKSREVEARNIIPLIKEKILNDYCFSHYNEYIEEAIMSELNREA